MRTLADHSHAVAAMHALAVEYPLLPAARLEIIAEFPNELAVSCFGSLADFEAWRTALHADPDSIEYQVTAVGHIHLIASVDFDGVTVLLHGYSPRARAAKAVAA